MSCVALLGRGVCSLQSCLHLRVVTTGLFCSYVYSDILCFWCGSATYRVYSRLRPTHLRRSLTELCLRSNDLLRFDDSFCETSDNAQGIPQRLRSTF